MLDASAIERIATLGCENIGKVVRTQDGREAVITPKDYALRIVEPLDRPLSHIKQAVKLESAESFVLYINDFKTSATRLFASIDRHTITALFDYHHAASADEPLKAAHLEHRAVYEMPYSEEWRRWAAADGQNVSQARFAEFLEENLQDIVDPDGATVLEVATQLSARRKVSFESGLRLQDGTVQISYKEETEHAGRGNLVVPSEFHIGIPVFFGGDRYKIKAFLRYRIEEGKLAFRVDLHRRQFVLQDAVQSAAKRIGEATGLTPLYGSV